MIDQLYRKAVLTVAGQKTIENIVVCVNAC